MTPQIAPRTIVEAFLPPSGETSLADIYDTANLAGIDDQPVRLAIRRRIAAGDVAQRGRGRAGALSLTSAGRRRLERDRHSLALAFAQDAGEAPWDNRWHLIAVSVPERDRAVRDALRRELSELGAVAISTGLYVSPHDLFHTLRVDAGSYLSTATSDDLSIQGTIDPLRIAEGLWPRAPIVEGYTAISDALRDDAADTSIPGVVRQLYLADVLERAIRLDPLLPLELRDATWEPTAIRAAWAHRWDQLQETDGNLVYRGWWPQVPLSGGC